MGPSIDLTLRRHQEPDPELLKQALKRPKLKKKDVEKGLGNKKKMRNMEVDEMGDLRGRVHIAKQDLNKLQTRKMKGLKGGRDISDEEDESDDDEGCCVDLAHVMDVRFIPKDMRRAEGR